MPIALSRYAEIINNYCIVYGGSNHEHIEKLLKARPGLESKFQLVIYLCLNSRYLYLADGEERVFPLEELSEKTRDFACIREIRENFHDDPIDRFLSEC